MLIQEDVQGGEIMEIKRVKLSEIRPYEKNPRRNDSAVDAVAASIKEFGWQQPIVVDKDGVIIAGHTRYKAAKKLKCKEVPVVYADNLTEEQVKAYRLADNKTSELAEWDAGLLAEELGGIFMDMTRFGFEDMNEEKDGEEKYTSKVNIPQYEIKGEEPPITALFNDGKCKALIEEIEGSSISDEEKKFLKTAAYRHVVFDYTKIAEFYAAASPECQRLMERSALVIIDLENAIVNGYVEMSETIERLREEDSGA